MPVIRTMELLGASDPCQTMLKRWRHELSGMFRGDMVTGAARFDLIRDRLPKQTESRDARHLFRERSGTRYSSAILRRTILPRLQ